MYTTFSINNFRVFDQEEMEVKLRPITILTGCNNSGKSSITKALCLMKDFCRQIDHDLESGYELRLEQYKLDFHKHPNDILGSFDLVRHHSKSKKEEDSSNQNIVYEFIVRSYWLMQNVLIHMEFGSMENDDLNDGYLQSFYIKTADDKIIYKAGWEEESYIDFRSVKSPFLYFLYGQHLFSRMQDRVGYNEACGYVDDLTHEPEITEFDDIQDKIYNKLGVDSWVHLLEWQIYYSRSYKKIKRDPDTSFAIKSPELGVYCYFPCLYEFKDYAKNEIRQRVNDMIDSQTNPIPSIEQKIIDLFLDTFEASDAQTLHEFVSQEEDKKFFYQKLLTLWNNRIPRLFYQFGEFDNSFIKDESDLPSEANWEVVIRAMDSINKMVDPSQETLVDYNELNGRFEYKNEHVLIDWYKEAIEDIITNTMTGKLYYSPTSLIQPQRLFSLENADDFSVLLKSFFDAKKTYYKAVPANFIFYNNTDKYQPCSFINKWLKRLGIAQRAEIKTNADGYGATVRLFDKNDRKGMLLADKGLGGLHVFTLLLKIETAILEQKVEERLSSNNTAGIDRGLVKLLPKYNQLNPITLALEEPEVHLHPNHQSILADMIVEAYQKYGIHFIIETHSEYLIRKLQVLVADKKCSLKADDISLNYVEREATGRSVVRKIGILEDGRLDGSFGEGFFDEAGGLSRRLLTLSY